MDKIIYGGDTETVNGRPLSMQFYSEDVACDQITFVNAKSATSSFLSWCGSRKAHCLHVVYIHNLGFDLIEFLWSHYAKLVEGNGEFEFRIGRWHIKGVYGTPTFCTITDASKRRIMLVDSFSFFRGSLFKAAALFCPDLPKLKHPKGLGEKVFTAKDKVFCAYAMRDAEVTYHIGRAIEKLHVEFDLQQCVSVADMAARIFRHRFLTYTIPQPHRSVIEVALASYHGGKNNVAVDPGWYEDVVSLDFSSAYPAAMASFPSFADEDLYRPFRGLRGKRIKSVPDLSVCVVSGKVEACRWPVLFSHSFKPLAGTIDRVCVQGFEVNEALRSGELDVSSIRGTYYDAERDHGAPALRAFVEDFYRRKETETDKVMRFMYKLILNSISGKFIQTRKTGRVAYFDLDAGESVTAAELTAGGMFHPFIASATTAHTRANIHRAEHQYKALHTATDGIFSQSSRVPRQEKGLGVLSPDARGTLLLIRGKLYILYGDKPTKDSQPSRAFKGKHIVKEARHGFQGTVFDLEKLVVSGRRKYTVNRPNRLKESVKRGLTPNEFVKREYTLRVGPLPVR